MCKHHELIPFHTETSGKIVEFNTGAYTRNCDYAFLHIRIYNS